MKNQIECCCFMTWMLKRCFQSILNLFIDWFLLSVNILNAWLNAKQWVWHRFQSQYTTKLKSFRAWFVSRLTWSKVFKFLIHSINDSWHTLIIFFSDEIRSVNSSSFLFLLLSEFITSNLMRFKKEFLTIRIERTLIILKARTK